MIFTLFCSKSLCSSQTLHLRMKKNIKIEQAAGNGQEATEQEVGSRDLFPTG